MLIVHSATVGPGLVLAKHNDWPLKTSSLKLIKDHDCFTQMTSPSSTTVSRASVAWLKMLMHFSALVTRPSLWAYLSQATVIAAITRHYIIKKYFILDMKVTCCNNLQYSTLEHPCSSSITTSISLKEASDLCSYFCLVLATSSCWSWWRCGRLGDSFSSLESSVWFILIGNSLIFTAFEDFKSLVCFQFLSRIILQWNILHKNLIIPWLRFSRFSINDHEETNENFESNEPWKKAYNI